MLLIPKTVVTASNFNKLRVFFVKHLKFQTFLKTFSRIKICKYDVITSNSTHEGIHCVQKIGTVQKNLCIFHRFSQKIGTVQNIHSFSIIFSQKVGTGF